MKPTILLEDEVYRKVMHWVHKSEYEVSGLGMVKIEPNGVCRVVSTMLLPQKNGSTHTDIEAEEVNKALYELRNSDGHLRWWWHSHVNMEVFWSSTDHDTIRKLGAGGWFVSTVFNKKSEVRSAYYSASGQTTPWGVEPLFIDELPTKVVEVDDPRVAEWDAEYTKNVTNQVKTGYNGWQQGRYWEKNEHGVYVQKGENSPPTTGGTGTRTTEVLSYNPAEEPPETRPPSMPKRVYKAWKKAWNAAQAQFNRDVRDRIHEATEGDYLGFDQGELAYLASLGWEQADIEYLFQEDFSANDILELADNGIDVKDVMYLLQQNYTVNTIMNMVKDQYESGSRRAL